MNILRFFFWSGVLAWIRPVDSEFDDIIPNLVDR